MRNGPKQDGFSLTELVLVLLLVCILLAIAVPNITSTLRAAREGSSVACVKSLANAQAIFYRGNGRFAIIDELFKKNLLGNGEYTRNAPDSTGKATKTGPTEVISDGTYGYSFRYTTDSQGYSLDADPLPNFTSSYRRFRYRANKSASGVGISGTRELMLVAKPSVSSPATTAYKLFNP